MNQDQFYLRYYVGRTGKYGHEFLEFEFRPDGEVGVTCGQCAKPSTRCRTVVAAAAPCACRSCVTRCTRDALPDLAHRCAIATTPTTSKTRRSGKRRTCHKLCWMSSSGSLRMQRCGDGGSTSCAPSHNPQYPVPSGSRSPHTSGACSWSAVLHPSTFGRTLSSWWWGLCCCCQAVCVPPACSPGP